MNTNESNSSVHDYPVVDLTRFFSLPECAIRCDTKDDLRILLVNMIDQHPRMMNDAGLDDLVEAYWHGEDHTNAKCYNVFRVDLSHRLLSGMCYWPEYKFRENGFEIIHMQDLISEQQESISESDLPFSSLF